MTSGGDAEQLPRIELYVHPDHDLPAGFQLRQVEEIVSPALAEVLRVARAGSPLPGLEEIEITLVSDPLIAGVHVEFMNIEGATDVITFDHGEILISTETAGKQALEHGNSIEKETGLYAIHGLLHLAGYADKSEPEFAEMAGLQQEILERVWSDT